jgi:putative protein-disulfide isomerase
VTIQNIAPELTVPFMVAVQKARYYFGKDLNLDETYLSIAEDLGIDEQTFLDYFHSDKARRKPKIPFRKLYNLHNLSLLCW